MQRLAASCAILIALAAVAPAPATAGALRVTPVRVDIAPDRQFCALTIANDGEGPVSVQVRGYGWSKDADGTDRLDPATGPRVNPSILTLARGASGLVRCSVAAPDNASREEAWRLIVEELPDLSEPLPAGGVRALLRLSIPVFRTPPAARPRLSWSWRDSGTLHLANSGNAHVQVLGLDADGGPLSTRAFYLLAGGEIDLPLAAHPRAITARTPEGTLAVAGTAP